jgi:RHS repeat-associated protein
MTSRLFSVIKIGVGMALLTNTALPQSSLTNGLICYYPFHGNANDALGNGNRGTLYNGAYYTNGIKGQANGAVYCDGTGAYVYMGPNNAVYPNQVLTWAVWFRPERTEHATYGNVFWDDDWQVGGDRGIMLWPIGGLGGIAAGSFVKPDPSADEPLSTTPLPLGIWNHAVFTSDNLGQKFYLNGALVASTNRIIINHLGRSSLSFGAGNYNGLNSGPNYTYEWGFKGAIANARIYNRALSAYEVQELYQLDAGPITVTSPNGGENWTAGTTRTITWTVSGTPPSPISYFGIDYSLDGGNTWTINAAYAFPPATSASWLIPSTVTSTHARVQVRAVNSVGSSMFWARSANDFTINSAMGSATASPACDNRAPLSGNKVTFTARDSTSSGPGCSITSYLWNFGDGVSSPQRDTSHTFYSASGSTTTFPVRLQVTDSCGKTDTQYLTICVTGQALGNNPQQPFSKDPVNLATGNYTYNHLDLRIPGRGLPFEFQRFYNSKDTSSSGKLLGFGWKHSYNISLSITAANSAAVVAFGDGHRETYSTNGAGGYVSETGVYNSLAASPNGYTLTTKERQRYVFDAQGRLTSIADKNSNTLTLAYNGASLAGITDTVGRSITFSNGANGCLAQITDPLGRTVRFAYDAKTNLTSVTDLRGGVTQFGYDGYHQVTNAIDPRGNTFVSMVYDAQKRVVSSQKDALLNATTFSYDFVNGVTTVTDAMGNISTNYYDALLRVTKIVDNLGNIQAFAYDTNNNRTKVVDKNGNATAYAYDGNGNVISKTDPPSNTTLIGYNGQNNPTNRVDALSGLALFRYDLKGNLTNTLNALGRTNTVRYDAFGQPIIVTDANGNSSTNIYDSFGNLIGTQDQLGDANAFMYDVVGRKTSQVDALGRTNYFYYDPADNLTASVNALGNTNSFTYDENNNRLTSTDYLGNTTTNIYDQKDRLVIIRDPLGGSVTNDYDALDRKIRVHDARGGVTWYGYDLVGNLILVRNAAGKVTRYTYDMNGNRTSIMDPMGNVTTNVFDSLNRVVFTQDALGHSATAVYDALGRRTQTVDALNRTNYFGYDALGRLIQFTDAAGGVVAYTYDNVGNRTSTTDPNGHTTTNIFDVLNRLVRTTDPTGGLAQFAYDAVGSLATRTDPNGQVTTYLYDANNRRTTITYPAGTPVTFGYDANGNRTSTTDSLGTTAYSYDALNRLTSVTDCYGKTVAYGYDQNGNRTSVTYPGNKTVAYSYDAMNRMITVTDWLNHTTTYAYDPDGNLTGTLNPNGSAAAYSYDAANRLIALTNSAPDSAVISSYQYTLDAVGNHAQVDQVELLQTTPVVGQFSFAYDNDNRMVTSEGLPQVFDANGNMTSINTTNLLVYDYENRLTQTVFGNSTNSYQYNGLGNRMSATRGGSATHYVQDVNSPLTQVLAETDSAGTVTAYYVYGLGLISRIDSDGNPQYYHYDSRGSTIALSDASGQITEAYAYDPFGRPINATVSDNRFRYLGRHGVVDEQNGLNHIRARYYSARSGRFVTKDPTGGNDDDSQSLSRYVYALNNPVRLIDINGLFSWGTFGTGVGDIGMGIGQVALTGVSAFYAGVTCNPLKIGSSVISAAGDLNEAMRKIDAGSANIANSFFDKPAITVADQGELFDVVFKSKAWETVSTVNEVYSLVDGLSELPKILDKMSDAATVLDKYSALFSPETLTYARVQLLGAVHSLFDLGANTVKLNDIATKLSGDLQAYNKPFIPESTDAKDIPNQPQRK